MLLYFVLLKYLGKIYKVAIPILYTIGFLLIPFIQTRGWLFSRIDPETRKYSALKIGLHPVFKA